MRPMPPVARIVALPPQPLELGRRVAHRPGSVVLGPAFGNGACFVACDPVESRGDLDPEPTLGLDRDAGPLGRVPRWVGLLPYESRRGLERGAWTRSPETRPEPWLVAPKWYRYPAVARITDRVLVVGDDLASVRHLTGLLRQPGRACPVRGALSEKEPGSAHRARIVAALELIRAGDIYQVNLARRFELSIEGRGIDLLGALSPALRSGYEASLALGDVEIVSTSPECFLGLKPDGRVWTSPIKGTRPRGADAAQDGRLARALEDDPKERAELAMVLDVERNDLGRVASTGTVRVLGSPWVRMLPTVHHRLATVGARLLPGLARSDLLAHMLPSGSVTGAPKVRAMEVIAQLEAYRRGLYTGAFGVLFRDGGLELAMAIRTLELRGGRGRYFAGGGIVADSDPDREVEETYWKARQLSAVLGGDLQKLVRNRTDK